LRVRKRVIAALGILSTAVIALEACVGGAACSPEFSYEVSLPVSNLTSCVVVATGNDASISINVGDVPAAAGCIGPRSQASVVVSCTSPELGTLACWRSCNALQVSSDADASTKAFSIFGDAAIKTTLTCDGGVVSTSGTAFDVACAL